MGVVVRIEEEVLLLIKGSPEKLNGMQNKEKRVSGLVEQSEHYCK